MKTIFHLFRINHYIKNILIFFPLVFIKDINNIQIFSLIICFFAFCLVSSAVYIINDIIDIEKDKLHPKKCKRPITSGAFKKENAIIISCFLIIISLFAAYFQNLSVFLVFVLYIFLNLIYSIFFKNILILDSITIAFFFLIRIFTGCAALKIFPSYSLIFLVFFTSMFFTFSKRKLEYNLLKTNQTEINTKYTPSTLKNLLFITSILSIILYLIFLQNIKSSPIALYLTAFLFAAIILRLLYLDFHDFKTHDPVNFLFNDKIISLSFYVMVFVLIFILCA